jgi:hypothetical protein
MLAVPAATPVATPEVDTIFTIAVLLLLQVPFALASFNVVVVPTQAASVPPMVTGVALTVTTLETEQLAPVV